MERIPSDQFSSVQFSSVLSRVRLLRIPQTPGIFSFPLFSSSSRKGFVRAQHDQQGAAEDRKELKPMQSRLPGPHHQLTVRQGKRPHTYCRFNPTGTYCWIFTAINENNNFTVTNGLSYFKNTQSIGVCCMAHCPGL